MNYSVSMLLLTVTLCCTIEHTQTQPNGHAKGPLGHFQFTRHRGFRDQLDGIFNDVFKNLQLLFINYEMNNDMLNSIKGCQIALEFAKNESDEDSEKFKIALRMEQFLQELIFTITLKSDLEDRKEDFLEYLNEISSPGWTQYIGILKGLMNDDRLYSYKEAFEVWKGAISRLTIFNDNDLDMDKIEDGIVKIDDLKADYMDYAKKFDKTIRNLNESAQELISVLEKEKLEAQACTEDLVPCEIDLCENKRCGKPKGARCRMTNCGECKSIWIRKSKEVECEEVLSIDDEDVDLDGSGDV